MDKYSFLNAASTAFFAELYDQYLQSPDSVEPSWRAFFQGFDFGMESAHKGDLIIEPTTSVVSSGNSVGISEEVQKEFQVVNLIDGYRTRGHLFTKTNPVRDRRKYAPNLAIESFGLTSADLGKTFTREPNMEFWRQVR